MGKIEKEMNEVYLNNFVLPIEQVNENLKEKIQTIADLCPQDAGLGVFKARAMYVALTGSPKAEWDACFDNKDSEHKAEQRELIDRTKKSIASNFVLYPNPTDNSLTINLLDNLKIAAKYEIYNSTGRKVGGDRLTANISQLSIGQLSDGIYNMVITFEDGQKSIKRFLIIH
jgi:hypothetical protein